MVRRSAIALSVDGLLAAFALPSTASAQFTKPNVLVVGDEELYDMVRDPAQLNNLAKKPGYSKQLAAMSKLALQLKTCKGKACVR